MKYRVTMMKAVTITVDVPEGFTDRDIEDEAYDQLLFDISNGTVIEPCWEMDPCYEVVEEVE